MLTRAPKIWRLAVVTAAVVIALQTQAAMACFMRSPMPVQVWLDHIHVEIQNGVAVKTYDCTFKNANAQAVVGGQCFMELEPGAQVDNMSIWVDGKEMKAEILDVAKAKEVFTDIVKKGGSPALLEYFGNQLITTKVPRIAPNGTVTVKLQYTTVLKRKGGLYRLQMLNTNPKALMQPLKSAGVTVKINSKDPIKNVYSPTHEIEINEDKNWDVVVDWKQENYLPKNPFVLYYDTDPQDVGLGLVAHRELDEEGAFMLMLSPPVGKGAQQIPAEQILPKDVVFCVDTSGSMLQGNKMEQARAALEYCVKNLRKGDRFNIVPFSTTVRSFQEDGLAELTEESQAKALRYVEKLHARGGTAIQEALELSLKHLGKSDRLKMIVFATDGLPTIGETDPQAILRKMNKKNTEDVRMFVFGEGLDVNTKLLDFLALNHRGEADYVLPEEDIAKKISGFFDRVGSPLLTDIQISYDGLAVKDVFPKQVKDIYRGEQVVLYGRYTGFGDKTITVTGNANGETKTFKYELSFPEFTEDDKNNFVPRLWAGKKVDYLLDEIRGSEEPSNELIEEVTFLAKRYGIVTPYTSFLMVDDLVAGNIQPAAQVAGVRARFQALDGAEAGGAFGGAPGADAAKPGAATAPASKLEILKAAKDRADSRRALGKSGAANALDEAADFAMERQAGEPGEAGSKRKSALSAMRYIGTRTFYRNKEGWFDSRFTTGKQKIDETVKIGSDRYIELLLKHNGLAKFLALGEVTVELDKKWIRFEK